MIKKFVLCICSFLLLFEITIFPSFKHNLSYADNLSVADELNKSTIDTRSIFTSLSISASGGNGNVWVTAKNDLTILPATIYVIVELFYSDVYREKCEDMLIVAKNSTNDLNMGESITAGYTTGGKEGFWQGRMRYRVDNKSWQEKRTGTMRFDASGNFIEYV